MTDGSKEAEEIMAQIDADRAARLTAPVEGVETTVAMRSRLVTGIDRDMHNDVLALLRDFNRLTALLAAEKALRAQDEARWQEELSVRKDAEARAEKAGAGFGVLGVVSAGRGDVPEEWRAALACSQTASASAGGGNQPLDVYFNEEGDSYSAAHLSALLKFRDNFIVAKGLWGEFVDWLPRKWSPLGTPARAALRDAASLREAMGEVRETLIVHAEEFRLGQITSDEFREVVTKAAAYLDKRLAAFTPTGRAET